MHLLWWCLVGVIAGWLTGKIMKGGGYGFFVDMILGIVGGLVGGFIARALGFSRSAALSTPSSSPPAARSCWSFSSV